MLLWLSVSSLRLLNWSMLSIAFIWLNERSSRRKLGPSYLIMGLPWSILVMDSEIIDNSIIFEKLELIADLKTRAWSISLSGCSTSSSYWKVDHVSLGLYESPLLL